MSSIGYEAHVDRAKVARAKRWNTGILLVSALFTAGLVVGTVVMFVDDAWPIGIVAGLGALAALLSVIAAVQRGRAQRLLVAADGDLAIAVSDAGVRMAGAPLIPWSEIVFVGVLDDRGRSARMARLPLSGVLASAALKAGGGTLLCELGVRDGAALKQAFGAAPGAERVSLWDPFDGTRRGLIPMLLDAVLDDGTAQQSAHVLMDAASRRGIPTARFTGIMDYFNWKNPMLDHKWPTPTT
ncbi:hypothetical protein FLP10_12475 [Agromyces intestinalis]|uniref:Uncharacterized protein n=1 Tax=Agromyces intestinalis TaxID=2592652 RepID=A0A5C1YHQ5_9MICO|nr:hypothetical protein [Agromyces intestinalis]QEO15138.1 hypothetical protein FLP10_12475 [Agromyces intestinalis]